MLVSCTEVNATDTYKIVGIILTQNLDLTRLRIWNHIKVDRRFQTRHIFKVITAGKLGWAGPEA
jgi:hypothetical protein